MSDDNEDGLAFQYICSHSRPLYVNMHIPFTDKEEEPMAQVNISSLRCVIIHINQVTVAPLNRQLYLSCMYLQLCWLLVVNQWTSISIWTVPIYYSTSDNTEEMHRG